MLLPKSVLIQNSQKRLVLFQGGRTRENLFFPAVARHHSVDVVSLATATQPSLKSNSARVA